MRHRDRRLLSALTEGPALKRDIGPVGSSLLSFNGIVGAGIFALPATLHLQFGTFSPWLFPIFGLLILLVAVPFARLAALFSVSGGPVAYVAPFGPAASFQVGWLYYIARTTAFDSSCSKNPMAVAVRVSPRNRTHSQVARFRTIFRKDVAK